MILDAAVFSPVAVAGYFTWRSALDGGDLEAIRQKLDSKVKGAIMASWQFWPIANVVNFGFVPVPFRVLYNNSLSVLWNGYLSHVNAQRLEQVVDARIENPNVFVPEARGASIGGRASSRIGCLCLFTLSCTSSMTSYGILYHSMCV